MVPTEDQTRTIRDAWMQRFVDARRAAENPKLRRLLLREQGLTRRDMASLHDLDSLGVDSLPEPVRRVAGNFKGLEFKRKSAIKRASYTPATDYVILPDMSVVLGNILPDMSVVLGNANQVARGFDDAWRSLREDQQISHICLHELAHATGHWSRLARYTLSPASRWDEPELVANAMVFSEEVIAEWATLSCLCRLGLSGGAMSACSLAYAGGYLTQLDGHHAVVDFLKNEAEMAADYMMGVRVRQQVAA